MSTPTSNTAVTTDEFTSTGLSIGLIVGSVVLAMIIIVVVIYVIKKRRNGGNLGAAPLGAPTAANGLGTMNLGQNAVPRTTMNMSSGRTIA
jgi:flagellar biogenesis protein FliO